MAAASGPSQVLGAGGFGCAFKPEFKCKDSSEQAAIAAQHKQGASYISKLFAIRKDFTAEKTRYELVKKFDPEGHYTVPMIGSCIAEVTKTDIPEYHASTDTGTKTCIGLTAALKNAATSGIVNQAVYEYGGQDLKHAVKTVPLLTLLLSLTPIIKFLSSMTDKSGKTSKFYHQDIKPANIVFDGKRSRLIDFGMSDTTNTRFNGAVYTGEYAYYPPESDVLWYIYNSKTPARRNRSSLSLRSPPGTTNYKKAIDKVLQAFNTRAPNDIQIIYQAQYESAEQKLINEVETFLSTENIGVKGVRPVGTSVKHAKDKKQYDENLHKYFLENFASKFDIYGLGITVAEVINMSFDQHTNNGFELAPEYIGVCNWVRNTTNFDVFTRWNAVEAFNEWTRIWTEAEIASVLDFEVNAAAAKPTPGLLKESLKKPAKPWGQLPVPPQASSSTQLRLALPASSAAKPIARITTAADTTNPFLSSPLMLLRLPDKRVSETIQEQINVLGGVDRKTIANRRRSRSRSRKSSSRKSPSRKSLSRKSSSRRRKSISSKRSSRR